MQIKKYEAPTMQEALDTIKRELGPEAIILQTKKHKKGFGLMGGASVEVTAAISDRALQKKSFVEKVMPEDQRRGYASMPASAQAAVLNETVDYYQTRQQERRARDKIQVPEARSTSARYAEIDSHEVEKMVSRPAPRAPQAAPAAQPQTTQTAIPAQLSAEVQQLKRMIEEMKTAQEESGSLNQGFATQLSSTPALLDAFEHLILSGVDKRFALGLVKKAGFELGETEANNPDLVMDQIAYEVMASLDTLHPLENLQPGTRGDQGPMLVALVGPTGVGKTTTVAKIASDAILKRNLRVGLINLDAYKIAAFDQLATYAKILNAPFRSVHNEEELKAALGDFQPLDLVLIDTTGRSQKDLQSLKEMNHLLRSTGKPVQSHLCVSAMTRDLEIYDIASKFSVFKPNALVMTKLDESAIFGSIYNASVKAKLPLSYFTVGQRVPEDLEEATRERVAALVMDL